MRTTVAAIKYSHLHRSMWLIDAWYRRRSEIDTCDRIRRLNEKPTPTLAIDAKMNTALEEFEVWCWTLTERKRPDLDP
jgi:hypothetical protein